MVPPPPPLFPQDAESIPKEEWGGEYSIEQGEVREVRGKRGMHYGRKKGKGIYTLG